ncbi:hypothetical protein ACTQ54_02570 [Fundicoccus sp. Sow4_H7]
MKKYIMSLLIFVVAVLFIIFGVPLIAYFKISHYNPDAEAK